MEDEEQDDPDSMELCDCSFCLAEEEAEAEYWEDLEEELSKRAKGRLVR
jgi:hypothetical protein